VTLASTFGRGENEGVRLGATPDHRAGHRVLEPLALLTPDEREWKVPVAKLGGRDAQHSASGARNAIGSL
jgi:hypothetical protein